ncbi:MAG: hypothetical protein NUV77_21370 [Thermoguttaceae bacterium]|nr:hypothetical protein [Thermoguttaceae bacterium]
MLEDQAGIAVVKAGHQGLEGLLGRGRVEKLQAGKPRPESLVLARVKRAHRQPAATRHAHQQRGLAPRAEVPRAGVQAQLGHRLGGEIGELELDNRLAADLRRAEAEADDARLAQRHVDHAGAAVALEEPLARLEGRAVRAHVEADKERPRIVLQKVLERPVDGIAILDLGRLVAFRGPRTALPEHPPAGTGRRRARAGHRLGHRLLHLGVGLGLEAGHLVLAYSDLDEQFLPRGRHGVLLAPRLELLGRYVRSLVIDGMAEKAKGHALDEPRQPILAHGGQGVVHRLVDGPSVQAVDRAPLDPVPGCPIRQAPASVLVAGRCGKGVMIVLDQKEHRDFEHRGHVQRLVKIAGARAAIANDGQAEDLLTLGASGPDATHHGGEHLPEMTDHGKPAVGGIAMVAIALATPGRTLGIGQVLAKQLPGRGAEEQVGRQIAVQKRHHVLTGTQRHGHARRRRLVAGADGHGALDVALLVQLEDPLLQPARKVHEQVRRAVEILGSELFGKASHLQLGALSSCSVMHGQHSGPRRDDAAATVGNPGIPVAHDVGCLSSNREPDAAKGVPP